MITYGWFCQKCDKEFETMQSIVEYDGKTSCPTCKNEVTERILSSRVHFIGTKVEDREYNPGLGQVVKNKKHREEIAKRMGLVEVGNDNYAKNHDALDKDRAARHKRNWDKV